MMKKWWKNDEKKKSKIWISMPVMRWMDATKARRLAWTQWWTAPCPRTWTHSQPTSHRTTSLRWRSVTWRGSGLPCQDLPWSLFWPGQGYQYVIMQIFRNSPVVIFRDKSFNVTWVNSNKVGKDKLWKTVDKFQEFFFKHNLVIDKGIERP